MANAGAMQDESALQLLVGSVCELSVGYFGKVDQSDRPSLALRVRLSHRERPTARRAPCQPGPPLGRTRPAASSDRGSEDKLTINKHYPLARLIFDHEYEQEQEQEEE
jgi:hypothetical protein